MIEQQGRIVRAAPGRAWVAVGAESSCSVCASGQGCGAGLFGRLLRRKPVELEVVAEGEWAVGQAVTLGIPEAVYLGAVTRMYALPLLAGLVGAWVCHYISTAIALSAGIRDLFTLAGFAGGGALALAGFARRAFPRHLPDSVRLMGAAGNSACGSGRAP